MRPSAQTAARQVAATFAEPQVDFTDDHLVDLARAGDTEALDTLLKRYTSYARSKARTYFLIGADREDIVQEGMIGLFKAIRDFDADKTVSFRSFAELCITRQIITAIKTATRQKHTPLNTYVSLHRPVMSDDEGERQLADFLASAQMVDPVELVVAEDEVTQIRSFLSGILSELEAEVLNMYLQGRSYQDIAGSLRRQAKSIDNALQRIKRKLELFLEDRERHAEEVASGKRVVHVSRFSPRVPGGVFADGAVCHDPDATLRVARELRRKLNGNGKRNGHNGNGHHGNGHRDRARAAKASKPVRTNGSKVKVAKTNGARVSGIARKRASARPGDLRAGLRYAVAAAARTGARATRKVGAKAKRRSR